MRQLRGNHKPVIDCFPTTICTVEKTTTQTPGKRNPSAISGGREGATAVVARTLVTLAAVTGLTRAMVGGVSTGELSLAYPTLPNQPALNTLTASSNQANTSRSATRDTQHLDAIRTLQPTINCPTNIATPHTIKSPSELAHGHQTSYRLQSGSRTIKHTT